MRKKVHALVFKDMPHVFECGVYREGTKRVGTFMRARVSCKACRKRLDNPEAYPVLVKEPLLKPCPCEVFFVEMTHRVRDICARCEWRR